MKSRFWLVIIFIGLIISSCTTSNKVVSSGFIQKRKYNKDYHIEWLANKGNLHSTYSRKEKLSAKAKPIIHQQPSIPNKDSNIISKSFIPQKEDEKLIAS